MYKGILSSYCVTFFCTRGCVKLFRAKSTNVVWRVLKSIRPVKCCEGQKEENEHCGGEVFSNLTQVFNSWKDVICKVCVWGNLWLWWGDAHVSLVNPQACGFLGPRVDVLEGKTKVRQKSKAKCETDASKHTSWETKMCGTESVRAYVGH